MKKIIIAVFCMLPILAQASPNTCKVESVDNSQHSERNFPGC